MKVTDGKSDQLEKVTVGKMCGIIEAKSEEKIEKKRRKWWMKKEGGKHFSGMSKELLLVRRVKMTITPWPSRFFVPCVILISDDLFCNYFLNSV